MANGMCPEKTAASSSSVLGGKVRGDDVIQSATRILAMSCTFTLDTSLFPFQLPFQRAPVHLNFPTAVRGDCRSTLQITI